MHIFHKWSAWSDPIEVQMIWVNYVTGVRTPFIEHHQRRTCQVCGLAQEREL